MAKRIAMAADWSRKPGPEDIQLALRRYRRYLEDRMLSASTIASCVSKVKLFLEWAGTDAPPVNHFENYREVLREKNT